MNETGFFFLYNLAHRSAFLDGVIFFWAEYLPYVVLLSAGCVLVWKRRGLPLVYLARAGLFLALSAGAAYVLSKILKIFFHTLRPPIVLPEVVPLFLQDGFAFPSGHAAVFFALAMAVYFPDKKAGCVFFVLAFLIGLARVAAGVHFPADILGGLALGVLTALAVRRFFTKGLKPKNVRL